MLLIGMFDSPFVRRVAITMKLLELPFEHANWSVGKDFDRIREYNPLGRVPTLVTDAWREALGVRRPSSTTSTSSRVPSARCCRAPEPERRQALNLMAMATGAAEKGVLQVYERVFRPEDKRHQPWLDRCRCR